MGTNGKQPKQRNERSCSPQLSYFQTYKRKMFIFLLIQHILYCFNQQNKFIFVLQKIKPYAKIEILGLSHC